METHMMGVGDNVRGTAPGLEGDAALERSALGKAIGAANFWHARAEREKARYDELASARLVGRMYWFLVGALFSLGTCGAIAWLR